MIIVPSGGCGRVPQKRNQIFHTNTEHKYSSYGDQITTKVSGLDLENCRIHSVYLKISPRLLQTRYEAQGGRAL